jgi:hypothetical protein
MAVSSQHHTPVALYSRNSPKEDRKLGGPHNWYEGEEYFMLLSETEPRSSLQHHGYAHTAGTVRFKG